LNLKRAVAGAGKAEVVTMRLAGARR